MLTIVLLPGLDGTGTLFQSFANSLDSDYQVKIVSYPATEPLGYKDLEAIARAAIPANGSFIILGESFSGPIAVALATNFSSQDRCKGLILCCSFVRNPHPYTTYFKPLVNFLPISSNSTTLLRKILLGKYATEALRIQLANAIAQVSPSVIRTRLKAVMEIDVSSQFARLDMPVLYLRASYDPVVPHAASRVISSIKPDVRLVELEAPHFLLQAVPDKASKVINDFIYLMDNVENSL